tara:strand:+ start:1597 stop:2700 length:1104 start_codon:yes stop_codon:yes gene_type:complete
MTKIYTAWFDITVPWDLNYNKHLYLVKDPDDNIAPGQTSDQEIIRGGDNQNGDFRSSWSHFPGNPAPLVVENGFSSFTSRDGLDNPNISTDYNEDGSPDTAADRHYTEVDLAPALAQTQFTTVDDVWNAMENYITTLIGQYDYGLFDVNCQAVVVTALSSVGVDFADNVPTNSDYGDYVGSQILLDGAGDSILTAFANSGHYTFHDVSGKDYFIVEKGAIADVKKDNNLVEWNNIVLSDYTAADLDNLILYKTGNDLEIRDGFGFLFNDILDIEDHFAESGGAADYNSRYLFVVDSNISAGDIDIMTDTISNTNVLTQIDTRLLGEYLNLVDFTSGLTLSSIRTATIEQPDISGSSADNYMWFCRKV